MALEVPGSDLGTQVLSVGQLLRSGMKGGWSQFGLMMLCDGLRCVRVVWLDWQSVHNPGLLMSAATTVGLSLRHIMVASRDAQYAGQYNNNNIKISTKM